ncbi:PAS domain-containing protein [Desulfuromonas acetexigens]|uniref:PAS domain S-box protein n=1 Tax=Trichloromonas acetexigens TaxID=38815 RepID=A0A550J5S9_9BACT|nr:PAS domain S-box protein [Desulfuromonas acetexigens]TRO78576.1 PAS domain S-box protein [Desulfuromonas acetexigens]
MNEERLREIIVEKAPDAVMFADHEGVIQLWNEGAEWIFGVAKEAALGRSLDLIIPERLRARHWQGYHQTMATGETRYGRQLLRVPALKGDGEQFSSEFSIVLVQDESGQPLGVAAILRDVSAQWQREKELKERIAVLESERK